MWWSRIGYPKPEIWKCHGEMGCLKPIFWQIVSSGWYLIHLYSIYVRLLPYVWGTHPMTVVIFGHGSINLFSSKRSVSFSDKFVGSVDDTSDMECRSLPFPECIWDRIHTCTPHVNTWCAISRRVYCRKKVVFVWLYYVRTYFHTTRKSRKKREKNTTYLMDRMIVQRRDSLPHISQDLDISRWSLWYYKKK